MRDTILILALAISALIALPSSSAYEDTTVPSYDTAWTTENGDRHRQIYICDRKERTETVIIIKNDSVLLCEKTKF